MGYVVNLTIRGTETVTLPYGRDLSEIETAAMVARILADYAPDKTPLGEEFTTELVAINIRKW